MISNLASVELLIDPIQMGLPNRSESRTSSPTISVLTIFLGTLASAIQPHRWTTSATMGDRLPATRQLAGDLGLSRVTVQNTFSQLVAEGFLTAEVGAGTFVAEIPVENLPTPSTTIPKEPFLKGERLSLRGRSIALTGGDHTHRHDPALSPWYSGV